MPVYEIQTRMKQGMFRATPGYPKALQIAALEADGVKPDRIFDWADRNDHFRTLRRNDVLCVHGLDRLGEDFDDVIDTLEALAGRGVKVLNIESGRLADPGSAADLVLMRQRLVGESRRHSDRKYKAIGKKLRRPRKKWAIADDVAARHWRDKGIARNAEAAALVSDLNKKAGGKKITVTMLQKRFGGSGRPAGWPRGRKAKET